MSRMPQYGKPDSFFSPLRETGQDSGHETGVVAKVRKEKEGKPYQWVYKKFNDPQLALSNPLLAQIEAGIASLYHLIEPDHNPKIRVVYDDNGKAIGTVSKLFPNYMSLKDYLGDHFGVAGYEAETEKKLNNLITAGLAKVLTLSHFFEEDDLHLENIGVLHHENDGEIIVEKVVRVDYDMSAYTIVGQDDLRGGRKGCSYGRKPVAERFLLTDRDLTSLPFVTDADPWYCPAIYRASMDLPLNRVRHAYTKEQVQVFQTLSQHPVYATDKFLTTLKITLFDDEAFSTRLSAHIQDAVSLERCKKFIAKKNELREMLPKNEKFQSTCEKLLDDESLELIWKNGIHSFFEEIIRSNEKLKIKHFNFYIDLDVLKNEYYTFCCVIVQGGLLHSFNLLVDFLERVESKDCSACPKKESLRLSAIQLRDVLIKNHQEFSELQKITVVQLNSFVENICVSLSDVEHKHKAIEKEQQWSKLAEFLDEMHLMLGQFIQYCSFAGDDVLPGRSALRKDSFTVKSSDRFVSIPVLAFDELMEDTVRWLKITKEVEGQTVLANKNMVLTIFTDVRRDFEQKNTSYMSQATSLVSAAASSFSFFFRASTLPIPTLFDELESVQSNLEAAKTPADFCRAIANLLVIERPGTEQFKNDFFSKIIAQFSREFSAKKLPKQMEGNSKFAEYLYAQANRQMQEVDIRSAVGFLAKKFASLREEASEECDSEFEVVA